MTVLSRRRALGLAFAALPVPARAAAASLKQAAAARGLCFGAAPETDLGTAPEAYRALLAEQCGLLAPVLPWTAREPGGEDSWGPQAAAALSFAATNRMAIAGSHLLWHEWLPKWFAGLEPADARAAAEQRAAGLARRFAGRVYAWNAVNEALRPEDGRDDGLRASPLLAQLGPDFIAAAFAAARRADPAARLLYNDYNLEAATRAQEAKRGALLRLLDRLLAAKAPIDGVGLQSHLDPGAPFDERRYRDFLREISGRGLRIAITELDVLDTRTEGGPEARDRAVADIYARFLAVALDEPAVSSVVAWGLTDPLSWQNDPSRRDFRRADGLAARPLAYDAELRPKPAFHAILHALENAPVRSPG